MISVIGEWSLPLTEKTQVKSAWEGSCQWDFTFYWTKDTFTHSGNPSHRQSTKFMSGGKKKSAQRSFRLFLPFSCFKLSIECIKCWVKIHGFALGGNDNSECHWENVPLTDLERGWSIRRSISRNLNLLLGACTCCQTNSRSCPGSMKGKPYAVFPFPWIWLWTIRLCVYGKWSPLGVESWCLSSGEVKPLFIIITVILIDLWSFFLKT